MCRSIKTLRGAEPPATEDEIRAYMKARHDARKAQMNTPAAAAMPGGPSATKGE